MPTKRKTPATKKAPSKRASAKKAVPGRSRRAGVNSKDVGECPLWIFEAETARGWLAQIEGRMDRVIARGENPHFKETQAEMKRLRTAVGKAVVALKPVQTVVGKLSA